MIEVVLQPLGINVVPPNPPESENDLQPSFLEVVIVSGTVLPPPQPGAQPLAVPSGNTRFALSKEDALATADKLRAEAEKLPDTSKIITADSLAGVDKLATGLEQFKSG